MALLSIYLFMYDSRSLNSSRKLLVFAADKLDSFSNGSLVFVKKNPKIKLDEDVLFYNFYTNKIKVLEGRVVASEKLNENETTYELKNGRYVSDDYVIAMSNKATAIPLIGYPFSLLTTSAGYLIFALLPTAGLFIYQLNNFLRIINEDDKRAKKD